MTLLFENEIETDFPFDYKALANEVITLQSVRHFRMKRRLT